MAGAFLPHGTSSHSHSHVSDAQAVAVTLALPVNPRGAVEQIPDATAVARAGVLTVSGWTGRLRRRDFDELLMHSVALAVKLRATTAT